jgi:hypothetical protein
MSPDGGGAEFLLPDGSIREVGRPIARCLTKNFSVSGSFDRASYHGMWESLGLARHRSIERYEGILDVGESVLGISALDVSAVGSACLRDGQIV